MFFQLLAATNLLMVQSNNKNISHSFYRFLQYLEVYYINVIQQYYLNITHIICWADTAFAIFEQY